MDPAENRGNTPGRSWSRAETSSQASRSPESTRRKRLSFFGRSSSEAAKEGAPSMHSTMSSHNDSRPSTARSESRRRTADPLESIRNSLRGRRPTHTDGADGEANRPRPTSRSVDSTASRSRHSASLRSLARFEKSAQKPIEDQAREYYQHRKKSSISPPFNFQHVTHTARKHLPRLETVDERDLKTKFWQLNAYQKPKERLNGIRADDLGNMSRSGSSASARRPVTPERNTDPLISIATPPKSEVSRGVDETLFDETQETKFNLDDAYTSLEEVNKLGMLEALPTCAIAKHYSSISALRSTMLSKKPQKLRTSGSFDHTISPCSPTRAEARRARTRMSAGQRPTSQPVLDAEDETMLKKGRLAGQSFCKKQPLPAVPREPAARPASKVEVTTRTQRAPSYSLFPSVVAKPVEKPIVKPTENQPEQPERSRSISKWEQPEYALPSQIKRSRFTHMTTTSKSFSSLGADFLGDSSWEDDIDFAYEQAAEAMCDFDWETASAAAPKKTNEGETTLASVRPSLELSASGASSQGGGVRLSAWTDRRSAFASNSSLSTRQTSDTSAHTRARTNSEAPSVNPQHKRGTSVGHKGFLAARSASTEPLRRSPDYSPQYTSAQAKTPPPKFSLTEADETVGDSTYSPATSTTHSPIIDSTIPEYLSDPESDRPGGARHRKSSSYGSSESSQKSTQSLHTNADTARWSWTSTSSIPDLMHSKRKSRSSMQLRVRVSRPLESVPHSPNAELVEFCGRDSVVLRDSLKIPSNWERASPDPIVMRRPENPGDTSLLLSAGRTVQRDRSSTPSNSRHGTRSNNSITPPAHEEEGGWI